MAKNQPKDQSQSEPGARAARKFRLDALRLATLCGVLALLIFSVLILRSIDRIQSALDTRLARIENRLAQVSSKVDTVTARNQAPAQRGPDPNRVYTINTAGSPAIGPAGAPVTIAEFSDFQ